MKNLMYASISETAKAFFKRVNLAPACFYDSSIAEYLSYSWHLPGFETWT